MYRSGFELSFVYCEYWEVKKVPLFAEKGKKERVHTCVCVCTQKQVCLLLGSHPLYCPPLPNV